MFIKAFGEYWNPFVIDWTSNEAWGVIESKMKKIIRVNFWNAMGVYVLYSDFRPVYVGMSFADNCSIFKRLADHRINRRAGRWDSFSWYCVSKPNITYGTVNSAKIRPGDLKAFTETLEAVMISVTSAPLNRRYDSIPGAREYEQPDDVRPKSVMEHLEDIKTKVDRLSQNHVQPS